MKQRVKMLRGRSVYFLCFNVLVCLLNVRYGYTQGQNTVVMPGTLSMPSAPDSVSTGVDVKLAGTAGVLDVSMSMTGQPSNNLNTKGTGPNIAGENMLSPDAGKLTMTPTTVSQTVQDTAIKRAPTNLGFLGTIPDTLVLSEPPHFNWNQNLGLNDIFQQEMMAEQFMIQPPVVDTEVVPATMLFDRQTAEFPVLLQNNVSLFRYPGKPLTPNPMVSVISMGHPNNWARKRQSAVLLSNRSPMYSGPQRIRFNNWIDLNFYKPRPRYNQAYKERFTDPPLENSRENLMTLLESGSVANFENQLKYLERSQKQPGVSKQRYMTVFDSLQNDMDLSVDPCEDFYMFACGGFVANATRKNGMTNIQEDVKDTVVKAVKWVLDQKVTKEDPDVIVKGKKLFQSCMNEQNIEMRGLSPVHNFLSDRGGWPVLGLWDPRRFNFVELLAQTRPLLKDHSTHLLPSGVIVGMTVQSGFMRPGTHVIYIDQPSLGQLNIDGMPNNEVYTLGRDIIYNKAYEDYLVDIAVALGAHPDVARRDMCDVVNFERALAEIMLPEEERRLMETRYRPVSILQMSILYPYFDWLRFIEQVLRMNGDHVIVKLSDKVVLWASPYFDRLGKVLSKTPTRVLANYVLLRAIQPMLPATNRLMQYIKLRYTTVANGAEIQTLPERTDICTEVVIENMDWLASRIYIETSLGKGIVEHVVPIKEHIKQVFIKQIEESRWLDRRTKHEQLLKIKAVDDRIAFPLKLLKDELLDAYYKDFNITVNFFENMEMVLRQNYAKTLQKLTVTQADDWLVRPSEVRTLYNAGANAIEIPATFFQRPYINIKYSPAMNFGGIGTLIANAYAHAYDVSGMKFDASGYIRRLWSDYAVHQYGIRADCLVNQYSNYFLPDANLPVINGNKTLNGNIPDNIAVKTGYYALQEWKTANQFRDLYELPFSADQLYFINYARTMCQSATPTYTRKLPYSTLYAVPRLRVMGPLQNSREFSAAFQCPLGSNMNPREKCSFW